MPHKKFAAVEGGGTSWRVAIAEDDPTNIIEVAQVDTTTPEETLGKVCKWLKARDTYDAIGIATFGPMDAKEGSPTYGYITSTPKKLWRMTDVVTPILAVKNVPFQFDTDVNAPAMAEYTIGGIRAEGCSSCAYITVGTGVGVGLVVNGQCVHGMLHPEAGHMRVPKCPGDSHDGVPSNAVPDGVESMCASGAIAARAGVAVSELASLPDSHPVWETAAYYLAGMCMNLILVASPEKIIISGGVLKRECLFPMIRKHVQKMLNGYIDVPCIVTDKIDDFIVPSEWKDNAGIIGALSLAQVALLAKKQSDAVGVKTRAPLDNNASSEMSQNSAYGFLMQTPQQVHGMTRQMNASMELMEMRMAQQIDRMQQMQGDMAAVVYGNGPMGSPMHAPQPPPPAPAPAPLPPPAIAALAAPAADPNVVTIAVPTWLPTAILTAAASIAATVMIMRPK
jgi:fructokinase